MIGVDLIGNQSREDVSQVSMKDGAALHSHWRLALPPMLVVILENRQTEPENLFVPPGRRWRARRVYGVQHLVYAADEQLVFVADVCVEGRSADIGAIQNLFHRDRVVALFADQGVERRAQLVLSPLDATIENLFCRPHG
jgi:hypothetical protein